MSITIKKIDNGQYTVDGLTVFMDHNGKWVGNPTMTPQQVAAFQQHLKSESNAARRDQ